jgi:hypothetical protein
MEWQKVGEEVPVKDEHGARPELDENDQARPTELIEYEPLDHLEFMVDDMARAKDRRYLTATLDNLATQRQMSPVYANDFEISFNTIAGKYIVAMRTKDGREYRDRDVLRQLDKELDFGDQLTILYWLRRKSMLAESKKKNSKQS